MRFSGFPKDNQRIEVEDRKTSDVPFRGCAATLASVRTSMRTIRNRGVIGILAFGPPTETDVNQKKTVSIRRF